MWRQIRKLASDELEQRREAKDTYITPLTVKGAKNVEEAREVSDFLWEHKKTWTIDHSKSVLDKDHHVKMYFDFLVPDQVPEKEFWQRFCFRCDQDRILKQLEQEPPAKLKDRIEEMKMGTSTPNLYDRTLLKKSFRIESADDIMTLKPKMQQSEPQLYDRKVLRTSIVKGGDDRKPEKATDKTRELKPTRAMGIAKTQAAKDGEIIVKGLDDWKTEKSADKAQELKTIRATDSTKTQAAKDGEKIVKGFDGRRPEKSADEAQKQKPTRATGGSKTRAAKDGERSVKGFADRKPEKATGKTRELNPTRVTDSEKARAAKDGGRIVTGFAGWKPEKSADKAQELKPTRAAGSAQTRAAKDGERSVKGFDGRKPEKSANKAQELKPTRAAGSAKTRAAKDGERSVKGFADRKPEKTTDKTRELNPTRVMGSTKTGAAKDGERSVKGFADRKAEKATDKTRELKPTRVTGSETVRAVKDSERIVMGFDGRKTDKFTSKTQDPKPTISMYSVKRQAAKDGEKSLKGFDDLKPEKFTDKTQEPTPTIVTYSSKKQAAKDGERATKHTKATMKGLEESSMPDRNSVSLKIPSHVMVEDKEKRETSPSMKSKTDGESLQDPNNEIPSTSPEATSEIETAEAKSSDDDILSTSPKSTAEIETAHEKSSNTDIPSTSPESTAVIEIPQEKSSNSDFPSTPPEAASEIETAKAKSSNNDIPSTSPEYTAEIETACEKSSDTNIPSTSPESAAQIEIPREGSSNNDTPSISLKPTAERETAEENASTEVEELESQMHKSELVSYGQQTIETSECIVNERSPESSYYTSRLDSGTSGIEYAGNHKTVGASFVDEAVVEEDTRSTPLHGTGDVAAANLKHHEAEKEDVDSHKAIFDESITSKEERLSKLLDSLKSDSVLPVIEDDDNMEIELEGLWMAEGQLQHELDAINDDVERSSNVSKVLHVGCSAKPVKNAHEQNNLIARLSVILSQSSKKRVNLEKEKESQKELLKNESRELDLDLEGIIESQREGQELLVSESLDEQKRTSKAAGMSGSNGRGVPTVSGTNDAGTKGLLEAGISPLGKNPAENKSTTTIEVERHDTKENLSSTISLQGSGMLRVEAKEHHEVLLSENTRELGLEEAATENQKETNISLVRDAQKATSKFEKDEYAELVLASKLGDNTSEKEEISKPAGARKQKNDETITHRTHQRNYEGQQQKKPELSFRSFSESILSPITMNRMVALEAAKERQKALLKEKIKELDLDLEDELDRQKETQDFLVLRSLEESRSMLETNDSIPVDGALETRSVGSLEPSQSFREEGESRVSRKNSNFQSEGSHEQPTLNVFQRISETFLSPGSMKKLVSLEEEKEHQKLLLKKKLKELDLDLADAMDTQKVTQECLVQEALYASIVLVNLEDVCENLETNEASVSPSSGKLLATESKESLSPAKRDSNQEMKDNLWGSLKDMFLSPTRPSSTPSVDAKKQRQGELLKLKGLKLDCEENHTIQEEIFGDLDMIQPKGNRDDNNYLCSNSKSEEDNEVSNQDKTFNSPVEYCEETATSVPYLSADMITSSPTREVTEPGPSNSNSRLNVEHIFEHSLKEPDHAISLTARQTTTEKQDETVEKNVVELDEESESESKSKSESESNESEVRAEAVDSEHASLPPSTERKGSIFGMVAPVFGADTETSLPTREVVEPLSSNSNISLTVEQTVGRSPKDFDPKISSTARQATTEAQDETLKKNVVELGEEQKKESESEESGVRAEADSEHVSSPPSTERKGSVFDMMASVLGTHLETSPPTREVVEPLSSNSNSSLTVEQIFGRSPKDFDPKISSTAKQTTTEEQDEMLKKNVVELGEEQKKESESEESEVRAEAVDSEHVSLPPSTERKGSVFDMMAAVVWMKKTESKEEPTENPVNFCELGTQGSFIAEKKAEKNSQGSSIFSFFTAPKFEKTKSATKEDGVIEEGYKELGGLIDQLDQAMPAEVQGGVEFESTDLTEKEAVKRKDGGVIGEERYEEDRLTMGDDISRKVEGGVGHEGDRETDRIENIPHNEKIAEEIHRKSETRRKAEGEWEKLQEVTAKVQAEREARKKAREEREHSAAEEALQTGKKNQDLLVRIREAATRRRSQKALGFAHFKAGLHAETSNEDPTVPNQTQSTNIRTLEGRASVDKACGNPRELARAKEEVKGRQEEEDKNQKAVEPKQLSNTNAKESSTAARRASRRRSSVAERKAKRDQVMVMMERLGSLKHVQPK